MLLRYIVPRYIVTPLVARYERSLFTACCGGLSEPLPLFTFVQPTTHSSVYGTCEGMQVFVTLTHVYQVSLPRDHSLSGLSQLRY